MNVYLDTSVVLRRLLRQRGSLGDWGAWERAYASVLMRVEALRTVDRLRLEGFLDDKGRAAVHRQLQIVCGSIHMVSLTDEILERAGQPLPTILGTLDALHLATALVVQREEKLSLVFLTHDDRLSLAAQTLSFATRGT